MKIFLLLLCLAGAPNFDQLVDQFFDQAWWPYQPSSATANGFHQYDSQLEDFSPATRQREIDQLLSFRRRFADCPASSDQQQVLSAIDAQLLELRQVKMWQKDPDRYPSTLNQAAFVLMSRNFASPEERLRSLLAREARMPALLEQARANLQNPPRIYTEIALLQIGAMVDFFAKDVPKAFEKVQDRELLSRFETSNQAVVEALKSYQAWLKSDLLPRSNGDFRLGAELFALKLRCDEMVDIPLDHLLEVGMANLRQNQADYRKVAEQVYPGLSLDQVQLKFQKDYPPPSEVLPRARKLVNELQQWLATHEVVSLPSMVLPLVEETPPFMRALTFASMDTPGPYEEKAKEAYYFLTLPEPGWTPQQVAEHMAGYTYSVLAATTIHEAYPGHYVQFLWSRKAPSKVRKLLGVGTNFEGWAHYCEQMMLDEGYGGADAPKLRLGQLEEALLRNARYIVGIQMHTGKMSFDEGVEFFVREGYQTHENALRETRRGTSDPTYLMYTLGKLEILKLREDYRKQQGAAFRLKDFHDRFLSQGAPPLKLVRQALGVPGPEL